MADEKFRDQAVKKTLYEYQQPDVGGAMLEQGETNSRVNQDMARCLLVMQVAQQNWKGKYGHLFDVVIEKVQRHNLNLDGFSRVQAIEMVGAHTVAVDALAKKEDKKQGLLGGLFG